MKDINIRLVYCKLVNGNIYIRLAYHDVVGINNGFCGRDDIGAIQACVDFLISKGYTVEQIRS